ncbi:hypothetical protein D5H75_21940 [Bailinhaonella thermotolerans]|uniref:Uncharacterized protein n=2 Tax=Bailinhaonella thermotolerans TaxID=1070861 RepID=A0A3A4API9_9ACTN|nr:hypothetical protein D5H75_21940 [Bailinhaonella thermotolerans]
MSLSGAALRGAPWKAAAITGGGVAAISYAIGVVLPGDASLGSAAGFGLSLFFLVSSIGAVRNAVAPDRVTDRARAWARENPWRFALWPAAATAALNYPLQLVTGAEGPFGAIWDSLWRALFVLVVVGVAVAATRKRGPR